MPVRRLSMIRKLALSVAATLVLTFGATREARAEGAEPATAGWLLGLLSVSPGAAVGLVTDVGIGVHLASNGHVPRPWALTGTIAWGLTTVGAGVSTAIAQINASESRGLVDWSGLAAGSWAILGFCTGSLGVSIYSLTRTGSNPPSTALFGPKVRLGLPMVAPASGGATLVLTGGF